MYVIVLKMLQYLQFDSFYHQYYVNYLTACQYLKALFDFLVVMVELLVIGGYYKSVNRIN